MGYRVLSLLAVVSSLQSLSGAPNIELRGDAPRSQVARLATAQSLLAGIQRLHGIDQASVRVTLVQAGLSQLAAAITPQTRSFDHEHIIATQRLALSLEPSEANRALLEPLQELTPGQIAQLCKTLRLYGLNNLVEAIQSRP